MAKEIKFGAEARSALEAGVNQLADTVRVVQREEMLYLINHLVRRLLQMTV